MNKVTKIGLISTLGLGIFSVGFFGKEVYTKATSDWQTNAINQANSEMGKAAYDKKTEIINGADSDIQATVINELSIEDRQKELQRLLDEYYKMKLQGVTDSKAFHDLELQIQQLQQGILDRYKKEIDDVFAKQGQ